jgi:hypothetical protein
VTVWADLETPLDAQPLFPVEDWRKLSDPRKDLSELDRQGQFVAFMRKVCPHMVVAAIPNAGKRGFKAQHQAKKEGMLSGAFDTLITWDIADAHPDCPSTMAMIEFKGFSSGKAGSLSQQQIEFGNRLHKQGHKVACFFSARSAIEWLRELGAPIRGKMQ